jgi:hypothetical protein
LQVPRRPCRQGATRRQKAKPALKRITFDPGRPPSPWLDPKDPAQQLFGECLHRGLVHARFGQVPASFYSMDGESARKCARVAADLHGMCLAATREVLARDDLLERFDIEPIHWERIRRSFAKGRPLDQRPLRPR